MLSIDSQGVEYVWLVLRWVQILLLQCLLSVGLNMVYLLQDGIEYLLVCGVQCVITVHFMFVGLLQVIISGGQHEGRFYKTIFYNKNVRWLSPFILSFKSTLI